MKKSLLFCFLAIYLKCLPQPTTVIWGHDCETFTGWSNTGSGNWSVSTRSKYSGSASLETNGAANYTNNTSYRLVSPPINLSNHTQCKLTFYATLTIEENYDGAYIEASGNGGLTWIKLYNEVLSKPYDGKLPSNNILGSNLAWMKNFEWQQIVVDLKDFEGSTNFQFRLTFGTDPSVTNFGMNVDEFVVYGQAKTYIHNFSSEEQIIFDNAYLHVETPRFRVSSDIASTFNRFKVEINKSPYFSDIAYIQEFGGSYIGGVQYTLTCNQLNPILNFEDNTTYYVRVAASTNNGAIWGKWSDPICFTWKTTTSSIPQWYQGTNFQFNRGTLSGLKSENNNLQYQTSISFSKSIATNLDDAYENQTNIFLDSAYCQIGYNNSINQNLFTGLRFSDIQIPKNAVINKAFIVVSCYYPHNPGYGISNSVSLRIFGQDHDNPPNFSVYPPYIETRTTIPQTVDWNINEVWYNYNYYQTPNITSIVQALVNRSGWTAGNAMAFIIKNNGGNQYREIRTIDSDPSHAPKLYVEYQNTQNGTIISQPITLASIHGATTWGRLFWEEEGNTGDFRVTVQRKDGNNWVNTALTNLDYSPGGINISSLGATAEIRLVGIFIPSNGVAPILKSWTVTTTQLSGNCDLTMSLNSSNLTPCKSGTIILDLLLANNGPDEATNIVVNFSIPSGLTLLNHALTKGLYYLGQWHIPQLQNGETVTLQIEASINPDQGGNDIVLTPSIHTLLQTDPNLSNNSVSLTLSIQNNAAPSISAIADQQTLFNTPFATINFTVSDDNTSPDNLIYTAVANNPVLIPETNFIFGGSGINRTLNITPGNFQYGITEINLTVSDGTCTAERRFNAQVVRHQFSNMEAATLVVGQPNFTSTATIVNESYTPGASSCVVGALGHLAVGSQHTTGFGQQNGRVMIWNSVPTTNGAPCEVVIGKSSTTSTESSCTQSLTRAIDGVAFSADGKKLLVSDATNNRVLIWNTIPTSTGQPADVVIGQPNFTTNTAGCAVNKLRQPRGLFVAPDGKLFIVDGGNNRVLIFNSIPTTNFASANVVVGQDDFVTNTRGNSAKKLNSPWYCTMSIDGKLLIADTENNRVLVFNSVPQQNGVAADYVIGQEDFGISSAGLSANKLNTPIGVTVSPSGILAIGEYTNNRVLIFNSVPQKNGASADRVIGQHNFTTNVIFNNGTGSQGTAANNNLYHPYNIYFDINDRLFVNGREMNRVLVFGSTPTQSCDLSVSINSDTNTPCMGNPVSYSIEVSNNGPSNATNVVVHAALPSGFYYYSHEAERGSYSPMGGNWQIPSLAVGETVSLIMTGTVNYTMGGATIEAFASVRSNNQAETNFANNSASKTITVTNKYAPVVSRIPNQQKNVSESTGVLPFTIFDENNDPLTVSAFSSNQTVVPNSNIVLGGSGSNRTIEVTPSEGIPGAAIITIAVSNGACITYQRFRVAFGNLWIGKTTDWHTASNWAGEIPKSTSDVYIPSNPEGGHFPHISNNAEMRELVLMPGALLTSNNPVTINISGNVTNNGNIIFNNATTNLTGSGKLISGNGKWQVHHLNLLGTLECRTNILISGTWNRTGTFNHTMGKVTFNGQTPQTITTQESFRSLGINNPSEVILNNITNVTDTLELINGTLTINNQLNLANNITISRTVGILNSAPNMVGIVNLIYKGSVTTSFEVPPTRTVATLKVEGNNIQVTLNNTLTVTNFLYLNQGIINTGIYQVILSNPMATSLIGGNSNSFINGTLSRNIATNTDSYKFPIGNGNTSTHYAPVVFLNNNIQGTSILTANVSSIVESGNNCNDYLNTDETGGNTYLSVIPHALWQLEPDIQPTGGTYGIQLYFNQAVASALNGYDNYFGILKRPSGSTSYADWNSHGTETIIPENGSPGRTVASGYAQRIGYVSFSEFVIAISEWPLPIQLKLFDGYYQNGLNKLRWITTTEHNNNFFRILRSIDGDSYSEIAKIQGAGNSTTEKEYIMYDRPEKAITHYYKLIQVDYNNKENYQGMVAVTVPQATEFIDVFPNPTNNILTIVLSSQFKTEININLTSMLGNNVIQKNFELNEGINRVTLDLCDLPPTVYQLTIIDGNRTIAKTIIKQ